MSQVKTKIILVGVGGGGGCLRKFYTAGGPLARGSNPYPFSYTPILKRKIPWENVSLSPTVEKSYLFSLDLFEIF